MNIYETLLNPKALPVPKSHCRAHYEGSIDKTGGNADRDWNLYQDENGKWVLFEHLGPGCICAKEFLPPRTYSAARRDRVVKSCSPFSAAKWQWQKSSRSRV